MSEPKHTSLPWRHVGRTVKAGGYRKGAIATDGLVADCFNSQNPEGDAALIVRAVNAYDELVAACLAALARPGRLEGWQEEQIRAALAKARPEGGGG